MRGSDFGVRDRDPRAQLLLELSRFRKRHPDDPVAGRFRSFVEAHPNALDRALDVGHVTASAWVVDRSARAAVLVFHPKLARWLQPGGHLEPGEATAEASLREAREETGLTQLRLVDGEIFDLDVHRIPARPGEPAHWHWDVRHLVEGSARERPAPTEEVRTATWTGWDEVRSKVGAESVLRLVRRIEARPARD